MAESFDLGSAHGSVIIDVSGVQSAMSQAQRAFDQGIAGIGQSLEQLGQQLTNVGIAITKLTAPMSAFIVTGVKVAASFEDVMTQIKVFGGVSGKELEKVRQQVLKWGADTVFSAQDAGEAMLNLLKAGMSVKNATAAMPAVLQLATVGNISLAQASDVVTQAMNQYGLTAKDTTRITDALAKGANASAADVADLGQALGNVGPIARQYGLSVEDTVAILSVFANNGIKGAEAGTQLKSMLLNLSRPTDKVKDAMKKLGISLYDAKGNMKPLNTFIKEMDAALKKLPLEQQNELMQTLGGSYGIIGLSALRASGGIDAMQKAMDAAPGAAAVADASVGTFNRALESLRGSLETLQIQVLTPFMDNVLKPLVNQFILIVNAATDWAQKNPALANTIIMIGAALSVLGPVLIVAGMAIGAIGTVIAFVFSPIGLLIAGIAALAAAFITNFGGIRDFLMPIINEIVHFFTGQNSLEAAFKVLTTEGGPITLLRNFLSNIGDFLSRAATSARELGQIAATILAKGLNDAATAADQLLKMGLLIVADTLNKAAIAAGVLGAIVAFLLVKALNDAATAAQQLLQMGLLLVVDTLNRASIAAGLLVALIQGFAIKAVTDLRNAAFDLAARLTEVSTNVGYLITGLTLLLGVLVVAKLIAMVQALAAAIIAVATAIMGGGGLMLALNPLVLILGLIAILTLAATTNFMGFGDRLKDVKRIIDEAVTSGRQLVDILQAVIDKINWLKGNPAPTNLPGVSTTAQGGLNILQPGQSEEDRWWAERGLKNPSNIGNFNNNNMMTPKADNTAQQYGSYGYYNVPKRDSGGFGAANLPYLVGKGAQPELVVPNQNSTFIPNADKLLGGGMQFAAGSIVINANSRAEGAAAAAGFEQKLDEIRARRGW